ncbi:hypothetical protein PQU95_10130 [Vogesella sp. DC21W]|uniref:Uncharacterized protein n=1 Tax=Vogesella aquatica TaxID=2984206 RepID=A0ABT5IYE0_9NEIS|nr:hypothetical protein [Vogesella aquatica]MDC7717568.1 hypothetical protein [Vogesella aquatica]
MKTIVVPGYVADEFNAPVRHPNSHADAVRKSIDRVYRLIDTAFCYGSKVNIEPYGFEWVDDKFYIYASERGSKSAMAIFKSSHSAAKYFVWLVSGGSRSIDWSLFPEMEL